MNFWWIDDENPADYMDVPWYTTGSMTDPSQALGSSVTYATRQFLLSFFQIAQIDVDIDDYRSKQKAAEEAEGKEVLAGIIGQFDTVVRSYMADHPDESERVREFVSKYVKNGLYANIKNPEIAGKLLADFRAEFKIEEQKE